MIIGNKDFVIGHRPYIMGILNVTPDSFSDGGSYNSIDAALFQVERMLADGADIIDIGGESTRPGYVMISEQEEIERVCPIISEVVKRFDTVLSLDTYKSSVAIEGIKAGVHMINDIWGLKWDEEMAKMIARNDVCCCIMHNRKNISEGDFGYVNYLYDVVNDLKDSLQIAIKAGIKEDKIILDPGVGFAKDLKQNRLIMNNLELIVQLGYPVLLGTSRKSMIGLTLDLPKEEREEGTLATSVIGLMKGCSFFRVHDVKTNARALKMTEAIIKEIN